MVLFGLSGLSRREQAYDLLCAACKEYWALESLPSIARTERGKPFFPQWPDRQFNLSHSGNLALCVLDDRPVGVDIQVAAPRRGSMLERVCSQEERLWLRERGDSQEAFALLWALKESAVKQVGTGLRFPISHIRVPLPEKEGVLMEQDGLWFRTYQGPGWQAALCGQAPPPETISWILSDKNAPDSENIALYNSEKD